MSQFHFIRPEWFLAMPALLLLLWYVRRYKEPGREWHTLCDEQLLPFLISQGDGKRRLPLLLVGVVASLLITALAGPVWERLPQPVFRNLSPLVIALDLSSSMDAEDIKPSRLTRARHKLLDILRSRREGQTALLVYAAQPYVISPLTDDTNTIMAQVQSLKTSLMPSQGSRPDLALHRAHELLQQSGVVGGDVLFITDGISVDQVQAVLKNLSSEIRLHVLAVGTEQGAPIPLPGGGFLKDRQDQIVIPQLDIDALLEVSRMGDGRYARLTSDDTDINYLLEPLSALSQSKETLAGSELINEQWQEEGPWILVLLIPLIALVFRRGYLVLVVVLILPLPQEAMALSLDELWQTKDQQGAQALAEGDPTKAADLFTDPGWGSVAHYQAGNYQQSLDLLGEASSADGHYNRGNALAKLGRLEESLSAYQEALKLNPDDADAKHNYELVKKAMEPEQQQPSQDSSGSGQPDESEQSTEQTEEQGGGEQDSSSEPQRGEDGSNASQAGADSQSQGDGADSQAQASEGEASNQERMQEETKSDMAKSGKEGQDAGQGQQEEVTEQQSQASPDDPSMERGGATASKATQEAASDAIAEQWLKRIPDDPGGLLRRKFRYQYQRSQSTSEEVNPW